MITVKNPSVFTLDFTRISPYNPEEFCALLDDKSMSDRQALLISILKWYIICHVLRTHGRLPTQVDYKTCGLCVKYNTHEGCYGCPIFEKTGQHHCRGTPYLELMNDISNPSCRYRHAQDELKFLKKLYHERYGKKGD